MNSGTGYAHRTEFKALNRDTVLRMIFHLPAALASEILDSQQYGQVQSSTSKYHRLHWAHNQGYGKSIAYGIDGAVRQGSSDICRSSNILRFIETIDGDSLHKISLATSNNPVHWKLYNPLRCRANRERHSGLGYQSCMHLKNRITYSVPIEIELPNCVVHESIPTRQSDIALRLHAD